MQKKLTVAAFALLTTTAVFAQNSPMKYPNSKPDKSVQDDFFGTKVADPYRALEDPNSDLTKSWVAEQNKTTFGYLDKISFKKSVQERLTKLWNFERYGVPMHEGDRYFFYKNDGLQNQAVLYMANGPAATEGKPVINPNELSESGTTSISGISFNKQGTLLAYTISEGGSDWNTIRVKDLNNLENTDDVLQWVKFSGMAWCGKGFFYSRYPEPSQDQALSKKNEFHALYYHVMGTQQAEDQLIYLDKANPLRNVGASTTEDERFLILSQSESTSGENLYVARLDGYERGQELKFTPIVQSFDNDYSVVDIQNGIMYVLTNYKAPNKQLVAISLKDPSPDTWKTIIKESDETIQSVSMSEKEIVCTYIKDAYSQIRRYNLDGKYLSDVKLPGIGTVSGFGGKRDESSWFYSFVSFTQPASIYMYDVGSGNSKAIQTPKVDFKSEDYETKQVFYKSKDGTKVPMFITHKKGLVLNGENPTWLYGYGGFDISVQPSFSISKAVFLEQGGVYCVANIRGGGEYGEKWHKGGTLQNKQNVFDDFIGAAEYLIAQKYTSKKRLAIEGRSNGGLLVGACMTQRPDLFAVCFPGVGVQDMLRYHKFTIGWAWASDYGKSDDSKEMFNYLYKYSPVHNCKPANYPATMITTADHDDRVVPAHSFKFAAALQAAQTGSNPTLIRIDTQAGHGAGKSTRMVIDEAADMLSFALFNMGLKFK